MPKTKKIKGWAVINKDCLDKIKREIWWGDLFFSEKKAKERAKQSRSLIKVPCEIIIKTNQDTAPPLSGRGKYEKYRISKT